jgi:hypothetical protein
VHLVEDASPAVRANCKELDLGPGYERDVVAGGKDRPLDRSRRTACCLPRKAP